MLLLSFIAFFVSKETSQGVNNAIVFLSFAYSVGDENGTQRYSTSLLC